MTSTSARSLFPLLLVPFFLGAGCAVLSEDGIPATPQRPTLYSDTSTTPRGALEIEAGVTVDPTDAIALPVTARLGLTDATELLVGWAPYQKVDRPGTDARGQGDLTVGTRIRFVEEEGHRPSAALQLATKIPTASEKEGLGSGEVDFFGAGILAKQLGPVTAVGFYQLGLLGEANDDDVDVEHAISLGASAPIVSKLAGFGELAGIFNEERHMSSVFTTAGLAYAVTPSLVLDAAITAGLSDDAPDFLVLFGVTTNLGRIF